MLYQKTNGRSREHRKPFCAYALLGPVFILSPCSFFSLVIFRVAVTIMAVQFFVLATYNLRQRNFRARFLLKVVFTQSCLGAKLVGATLVCQTVTKIFLDTAC